MINFFLGFIFLLLQAIKDIKTYEIDEKMCYIFSFLGIVFHFILFIISGNFNYVASLISSVIFSFVFFYILWKIGFIGGGDLKVFLTISFLVPVFDYNKNIFDILNYFPIFLFIFSIIMTIPYAIFYTLSKRSLSFWIKKVLELKKELYFFTGILIVLYIKKLLNIENIFIIIILMFFIFKILPKNKDILVSLFVSFLIVNLYLYFDYTVNYILFLLIILLILIYLKNFRKVLSKRIDINLSEGEISCWDYFLIEGKIKKTDPIKRFIYLSKEKPIVLSRASGITNQDIKILKKYGIKEIEVKDKIPFVPSILIAFVILYFFWKFW